MEHRAHLGISPGHCIQSQLDFLYRRVPIQFVEASRMTVTFTDKHSHSKMIQDYQCQLEVNGRM